MRLAWSFPSQPASQPVGVRPRVTPTDGRTDDDGRSAHAKSRQGGKEEEEGGLARQIGRRASERARSLSSSFFPSWEDEKKRTSRRAIPYCGHQIVNSGSRHNHVVAEIFGMNFIRRFRTASLARTTREGRRKKRTRARRSFPSANDRTRIMHLAA